jgi:hypothetical protein
MIDEGKYLRALAEINSNNFNEKEWLIHNFELYKTTRLWPTGLPSIAACNLIKGTLKEKFNATYTGILYEFEHEVDNVKKTLIIKDKNF